MTSKKKMAKAIPVSDVSDAYLAGKNVIKKPAEEKDDLKDIDESVDGDDLATVSNLIHVGSENNNNFVSAEEYAKGKEVILSVRHLKQYFKFAKGENKYNKAVHDVSFDIYKGEVFGLVGESGCGKTTTGRSIIKLYDITSGSIYFDGQRISAGTRWNEKEIKWKTKKAKEKIKELKSEEVTAIHDAVIDAQDAQDEKDIANRVTFEYEEKIEKIRSELSVILKTQHQKIRQAKYDNAHCNKSFIDREIARVKQEYQPKFAACKTISDKIKLYFNYISDYRIAKNEKITSKMQMIFQDPIASLDPRMTVREIIAEGLRIKGITKNEIIDQKVNEMLKLVGLLPEHATRYPHEFSGGQRQRIGIARALVMNPDLIIADEPVSALDVSIQAQVINLLNDLKDNLGLTILFIAHDLSVVKYFCDRIAVMYFGKIVELTTSDELFRHPCHPYTRSLLSAIPIPDPHFEKQHKRIIYVPSADHDYSKQKPSFREVVPGHFIDCNDEEEKKYRKICEKN